LDFKNLNILLAGGVWGTSVSSCQISSKSVKQLQRYYDFSTVYDGSRSLSWVCLGLIWTTHVRIVLDVFITVVAFTAVFFNNMKVSIIGAFGLKKPILTPKLGFW